MKEDIYVGDCLIVKSQGNVFKIKILEVTDCTYFIQNIDKSDSDREIKYRTTKDDFSYDYKIIERLHPNGQRIIK